MSYSDYGAYVFFREPGKVWARRQDREDATLSGIVAPEDRPLEYETGMKLDVLLNAAQQAGIGPCGDWKNREDFMLHHPAHAILGSRELVALWCFKSYCSVMMNDREVVDIDDLAWELKETGEHWKERQEELRAKISQGSLKLIPATGELCGARYAVKIHHIAMHQRLDVPGVSDEIQGTMAYLAEPSGIEWLALHGYGIGEHWWQDEQGYRLAWEADTDPETWERESEEWRYPQPKEALAILLAWHESELV